MKTQQGQAVRLSSYQESPFLIKDLHLDIRLDPEQTIIIATLQIERKIANAINEKDAKPPLILSGEDLTLDFVSINGIDLPPKAYQASPSELIIPALPDKPFELQITTRVNPTTNTQLMGLYCTSCIYCTQCEAEGFRRITYFLDRPDILTRYTTRLEGKISEMPVLLANGNLVEKGCIQGTDRHYAIWHDPHPKPSYLFALVAGDLAHISDRFTTMSGRDVDLRIYVEPGKEHLCDWAMESLKKCMKWDEETFGREYDLDIFMIVAVSDFNMGAMENKGLNIFNDKYVLADVATATDQDFANIEAIIAHEYFHNWTGNRITCRDWFQLCLKEGLTVFRDQEFTSDMRSRAVKRINDVCLLRSHQFIEDAGPLSHPVRPEIYHEINNFYTSTVYEKGAELVRMIKTIAGESAFKAGLDLYFERHDGEAVTIEDFLKAIEDGGKVDLTQFSLWYSQSGTPQLVVSSNYNQKEKRFTLEIIQSTPATPGQDKKEAMHIPIRFGLIGAEGNEITFDNHHGVDISNDVIHVKKHHHQITFDGVQERPVPSLLRNFSAPVCLECSLSEDDLIHILSHDTDSFNRWQAMQTIAMRILLDKINTIETNKPLSDAYDCFYDSIKRTLLDEKLDAALKAQFLAFPNESDLAQHLKTNINPAVLYQAHKWLEQLVSAKYFETLVSLYRDTQTKEPYNPDGAQVGKRSLKNSVLNLLVLQGEKGETFAIEQYKNSDNLTDRLAALTTLVHNNSSYGQEALQDFDHRYRKYPLVMDKWFIIQATAPQENTLQNVKNLMKHPIFSITNPNRVRSLIHCFASGNYLQFNRNDGAAYQFISSMACDLDSINSQVAARLLTSFDQWKTLEPHRKELANGALKCVANTAGLSRDVKDIITRILS